MSSNYFQGKDGFIWWNGVVEDRKDPLFLGRCRVRILGWHTSNKSELPTENLPWAFPIMPITSASQTGAGEAPVGPVEGTWVMGYYRDGELAQEPVMMGTMHGIPSNYAKQKTGFNDSRLDVKDSDRHTLTTQGGAKSGGGAISLVGWPYPPKSFIAKAGKEVTITEYTNEERQALTSKSLYPRNINEPTTSRYARGEADASAKTETEGIIATKNKNLLSGTITSVFVPSDNLEKNVPLMTVAPFTKLIDTLSFTVNEERSITQPPSAYAAVYPFNHVYESESGHLIEMDDTPTKERLHWYHRSGTFTEFHPKGIRTDRTNAHRYNMVVGNQETIIGGAEKKIIDTGDSFTKVAKSKHLAIGQDFVVTADGGDVILGAPAGHVVLAGANVVIDGKTTLMLNAPTIVRSNAAAVDIFKGSQTISAQGGFNLQAGGLTLGSMGATKITSFGSISQVIGGTSEETLANGPVVATTAKTIKAAFGKIVLETVDPITGGIDLNVGPFGMAGRINVKKLGDIHLSSSATAKDGISIVSFTKFAINALVEAKIDAKLIEITAAVTMALEAKQLYLNGDSEPAVLGNKLSDALEKHTHPSSVGPTGTPMPAFAMNMMKALSLKTYIG